MNKTQFRKDVVTVKSFLASYISATILVGICSIALPNFALLLLLQVVFVAGFLVVYSKALNAIAKILSSIIMIVIVVTLFVNSNKPEENYADLPVQQEQTQDDKQDESQEEEKQEENDQADQTTTVANSTKKSSYQRKTSTTKYGTDPQNVNDKVSISYGGGTSTHNSMSAGVVNPPVGGSVSDMQGESVKPNDPIDTDGKDVTEENDGVISVGGGATEEEQNDANGTSRQY